MRVCTDACACVMHAHSLFNHDLLLNPDLFSSFSAVDTIFLFGALNVLFPP